MIESNFERTAYLVPDEPGIEQMSSLLRGEISATEAYESVLKKLEADPDSARLHEFLRHHQSAVEYWKTQLDREGVESDETSGPWGTAVEAFVATAKLLGNVAALSALKEGEEHGLKLYEEMLLSTDLAMNQRSYIRDVLIPKQHQHIASLEAMKKVH